MTDTYNIAGRIHSTSQEAVVAVAEEILDAVKNKKQSAINHEVDETLSIHETRLNACDEDNFVTVATYASLPATGALNTIYRVANWDGGAATPAVDASKYSEYAWDGTQYVLLCVSSAVGEVFDISEYNAVGGTATTYADLAAALGTNGANVPEGVRRGGMSVKFIQSSDHKYVRYNLLADEFTTDTTQWTICDDGVYIENPEFIAVWRNKYDQIMFAVKENYDFYFGAGVPKQIKDYVLLHKTEILSLLQTLQNNIDAEITRAEGVELTKVDKVEGKGLIQVDVADMFSAIENPEYLDVETNIHGQVFGGRKKDGTKVENMPVDTPSAKSESINNPEWISVLRNSYGGVFEAINKKGERVFFPWNIKTSDIANAVKDVSELNKKSLGNYNPRPWFEHYGYVKEGKGSTKNTPLLYRINGNYHCVVSYPNGTLFYSTMDGKIERLNLDGTKDVLLTITGFDGVFDNLWFDSHYNLYTSPQSVAKDANNGNSGLYRLAYGGNTFTHVLSLYDPNATNEEARVYNSDYIRDLAEDNDNNLYCAVYGGLNNERLNPSIYKSTDGGNTWVYLLSMLPYINYGNGKHIHALRYNQYDNKLYCVVGEINKIFRSSDGGNIWEDMNCPLEMGKGFSITVVSDGLVLGSDDGYFGGISKVYGDLSYKTVTKFWALSIPTIRISDLTGWLYAFGWIDWTYRSTDWYPPLSAIDNPADLAAWKASNPPHLKDWETYNAEMSDIYPEDAIVPRHFAILVSKDKGETWEILYKFNCDDFDNSQGVIARSDGYFRNGEISFIIGNDSHTYILSEGKHKYTSDGVDCEGEVLVRLNSGTTIVEPIIM